MADWTPQSRAEEILFKTINGEPYDGLPQSRIEELLLELKEVIEEGGGGGGGTDNYNSLKNLPQINGQTVKGNMSGTTLGLVNMVMGKDLSTNDYTNADKAIVDSVTAALADKVDKVPGKGLSTNDFTDSYKEKVDTSKKEFIGTMAQWNALTTAEKKAFDTYQITDDYSEALMPNYSTTEQKTGQKWIDGKDIYFKTEVLERTIQINPTSWTTITQGSYSYNYTLLHQDRVRKEKRYERRSSK